MERFGARSEWQRRGVLRALGGGAAAIMCAPLAGCGEGEALSFANWENYLGETTLDDFSAASGASVIAAAVPPSARNTPRRCQSDLAPKSSISAV